MRALLIDNCDSFTFNLYQLLAAVNREAPVVVRNDRAGWDELERIGFESIVISPGPGRPEVPRDFGVSRLAIERSAVPLLGVCLGHQGIAALCGGRVVHAAEVMHGRSSAVRHDASELFAGIPQGFRAVRYHSLVVDPELPDELEAIAWTEDGVIMALRHRRRPLWGVQFHPESIGSEHGRRLLENFRAMTERRARPPRSGAELRSSIPRGRSRAAHEGPLGLVWRKLGFWIEPEQAYLACYAGAAGTAGAFWLDSSLVVPGLSRFSYMGDDRGPLAMRLRYDVDARELVVEGGEDRAAGDAHRARGEGLLAFLRHELERRRASAAQLPFDFQCGFVGYLGYEMKADCGASRGHRSRLPDAAFLFADRIVAFDHAERAVYLVALAPRDASGAADGWLAEMERRLEAAARLAPDIDRSEPAPVDFALRRDRARYLADIDACLAEIGEGHTYEVCLTNQLWARVPIDGLRLHRVLRRQNPAPYAALLRLPDLDIVCSSPERFLTVDRERRVESRPIKGTRPRGATPERDAELAAELGAAEKDRAENLMIVDLVRNDLGVVCETGSVEVPGLMQVESYAAVHQLVSTVRGRLRDDVDVIDCIEHAFPPGSMTGAPKLRTMEILDRLEGKARGVYSGAIGFLSASGAADLNVVIRTAVVTDGEVTIGTGGAIVALSDPAAELDEMLLKGRDLMRAVGLCGPRDIV
jgi:para-aminobenzoate synthetase